MRFKGDSLGYREDPRDVVTNIVSAVFRSDIHRGFFLISFFNYL